MRAIIGPAPKLHITVLIIKWKPRDVYLARAHEYTGWYIQTRAVVSYHHVRVVGTVELFVSTETKKELTVCMRPVSKKYRQNQFHE